MNFEGRVALITGGTAGIGEATVRHLPGSEQESSSSVAMKRTAGASSPSLSATAPGLCS
jgi:NAD(P)-dependent dehydrogenase (short-subunit alcohol dehydrogenase family)